MRQAFRPKDYIYDGRPRNYDAVRHTCNQSVFSRSLFTGKERDTESGNDYFGARYYASSMGRFMSPDPSQLYYADPANPQSLNLYSYGQNNPLINIDPNGMDCVMDNGDGTVTTNVGDCDNLTEARANAQHYIDCDGCTSSSAGATLDTATGSIYLTDANGNGIAGTTISGWADPTGVLTKAQTSALTGNLSISGYGAPNGLFFEGPDAALFPQLRARPSVAARNGMILGCVGGLPPDYMIPLDATGDSPEGSLHPTEQTTGQRNLNAPAAPKPFVPTGKNLYEHQRNVAPSGGLPLNSGGDPEAPGAAAEGAALLSEIARCIANVNAFSN